MYYRVKLNLKKMSVEVFDQAVENVFTKMNGASLFAEAEDEVAELNTTLTAYRGAVADATRGGKHATTVRDQIRTDLENRMRLLAYFVQRVAQGDRAVILAAGFDHNKSATPNGPCGKPTDFRVSNGPIGSRMVSLRVKAQSTARAYRFGYRTSGSDGAWTEVSSFNSSAVIGDLGRFVDYEFRAVCLGTDTSVLHYSDTLVATVV